MTLNVDSLQGFNGAAALGAAEIPGLSTLLQIVPASMGPQPWELRKY